MGYYHRYAVSHVNDSQKSVHCCAMYQQSRLSHAASACTGASRGIGQAIAEQMADEKANLILLAQREGALNEVMLAISKQQLIMHQPSCKCFLQAVSGSASRQSVCLSTVSAEPVCFCHFIEDPCQLAKYHRNLCMCRLQKSAGRRAPSKLM